MQKDMTRGPILPLILQFLFPMFIGNVFQQLYNMADMIIVGRYVGAGALAAVGSTGTLMFLVLGFALGITAGFGILTSQRFGAKDEAGVRRSVANGTLLAVLLSLAMTLLSTAAVPWLLDLMNTPADIWTDARTYITIIFQGLFTNVFYNMASVFLRSVGNSKAPLFFLVFSACLNVGLDLLCIIQFGMGVAGAALATVLSQGISVLLCVVYIFKKVPVLVPKAQDWGLYRYETKEQLRMGVPMALQFSITASGVMIAQAAINLFGSTAVAAYTAASKVSMLLTQGCLSMGQQHGDLCRAELRKGGPGTDPERGEEGPPGDGPLFGLGGGGAPLFAALPGGLLLFRRGGPDGPFALGPDLRGYRHVVLPAAQQHLHLPERHAGGGVRPGTHLVRRVRTGGPGAYGSSGDADPQLRHLCRLRPHGLAGGRPFCLVGLAVGDAGSGAETGQSGEARVKSEE